jgi:ABC-type transport system involved in multi-copper enzyme maturation permease subunit
VSFSEAPQYRERTIPLPERISDAGVFFLAMILYTGVIFFITFVVFTRYDVR